VREAWTTAFEGLPQMAQISLMIQIADDGDRFDGSIGTKSQIRQLSDRLIKNRCNPCNYTANCLVLNKIYYIRITLRI